MSLSLIERKGQEASLAVTMDVTGHEKQADGMLAAIEKRFAARKGTKSTAKAGDTTLQVFNIPAQGGGKAQTDGLLYQRQFARRDRRQGRGRSDDQAVCRQRDRQLEIAHGLPGDDGALPARGRQAGAGGAVVHRSVRLYLRGSHAARANVETRVRTLRRSCTTTASTRSKVPAVISINWWTATSSSWRGPRFTPRRSRQGK